MTFNQRAVMHNRRGQLAARQGKKTPTVLPKPTATSTTVPTTTVSVPKPVSASSISRPAASISTSVLNSLSSSTSSSLPVSLSTSSIVTPPTISTIARAKPTSLGISSSTLSAPSSSTSTAPTSTRGLSTTSLIGIIGGCIGAIAVICLIVAFFLRRLRKQKTRKGFDPTEFRRSANLLDEKDEKAGLRPRPPTMIERRKVHTAHSVMSGTFGRNPQGSHQAPTDLSAPLSLYGNSDDEHGHPQSYAHYGSSAQSHGALPPPLTSPGGYSGIPGAYGVPPPLAPVQHEHAGYGAPPIPGTYGPGAYAAYGSDPRYPYQHQHQGYPHFSPYHQHAQQHQTSGYAARNPQPPSVTAGPALPNPFVNSPTVLLSTSPPPVQSSGAPPAYVDEDDSRGAAARNDVKPRSVSNDVDEQAAGSSPGSTAATPALVSPPVPEVTADASSDVRAKPNSTVPRPTSSYTLYDNDDAYGGM